MSSPAQRKPFDLNIASINSNWTIAHAIREIIANAIDETITSNCSKDMEITYDNTKKMATIQDYGRGIKPINFVLAQNPEKLTSHKTIGKFGVGLKDAISVLINKGLTIGIFSKHASFGFGMMPKHGFDGIQTLHGIWEEAKQSIVGTLVVIYNCEEQHLNDAKSMFIKFSDITTLCSNEHGIIYEKRGEVAEIFINGLKYSNGENYEFSYNITKPTKNILKSLNRERQYLQRSIYSSKIATILKKVPQDHVLYGRIRNIIRTSKILKYDLCLKQVKNYFNPKIIAPILPMVSISTLQEANLVKISQLLFPIKQFLVSTGSIKANKIQSYTYQTALSSDFTIDQNGDRKSYHISINSPGIVYINSDILNNDILLAGTLAEIQTNSVYNLSTRKLLGKMIIEWLKSSK